MLLDHAPKTIDSLLYCSPIRYKTEVSAFFTSQYTTTEHITLWDICLFSEHQSIRDKTNTSFSSFSFPSLTCCQIIALLPFHNGNPIHVEEDRVQSIMGSQNANIPFIVIPIHLPISRLVVLLSNMDSRNAVRAIDERTRSALFTHRH